jgi:hypothetical protein
MRTTTQPVRLDFDDLSGFKRSAGSPATAQLDEETRAMITALATVNGHIPKVVTMLAQGKLPLAKQREFASLLTNLGELLSEHAASRARVRVVDRQSA